MRYIFLTFKNIGKFMVFQPAMFIFLIFAQVVCCVAVFISCGLAYNMEYVTKEAADTTFNVTFEKGNSGFTQRKTEDGTYERFYLMKDPDTGEEYTTSVIEHKNCPDVKNGKALISELMEKIEGFSPVEVELSMSRSRREDINEDKHYYIPQFNSRLILDEEKTVIGNKYILSDENIILAPVFNNDGTHNDLCPFYIGESYTINGISYDCVADNEDYCIPYTVLPNDFVITEMFINFDNGLTKKDISEISGAIRTVFGKDSVDLYPPPAVTPDEVNLSYMLFVISGTVIIMILLAISKYYSFVLEKRAGTLTVLRLCGCTRTKAHIVYMLEIFITMSVTTGIGYLLYRFVFHSPIAQMYPAFAEFYITPVYLAVIGAYFAAAMIIMAVTVIPATKADIRR